MRYLYLLRHAKAAQPQGTEDKHRPLTKEGLADVDALGELMKAKGYIPDMVLCSPARRTQQTYKKLCDHIGERPVQYPPALYYSTTGQIYEEIKKADPNKRKLLVVSHNPTIHALARFLVGLGTDQNQLRLSAEYKECTLTVLECPVDGWLSLEPNRNDLMDLLVPGVDFKGAA